MGAGSVDFTQISLFHYVLAATAGLATGIIGGVAGYGSGLLLPLVLVPVLGPESVVPVISVVTMFSNSTRAAVFWSHLDKAKTWLVAAVAFPSTILGAWAFTLLTSKEALILIGSMLITLVPLRRWLKSLKRRLGTPGLATASVGYGFVSGGTTGAGVILLSMLMWAGLEAKAVIATDAAISVLLGFAKVGAFQTFGALPASSWLMALVIGIASAPGASIAKRLAGKLTLDQHTGILDAVVILGGLGLIAQSFRG